MQYYVTDTHALYWYLIDSPRLGPQASAAFDEAEAGHATILISTVVMAELYYLQRKAQSQIDFSKQFREIAAATAFEVVPLLPEDIAELPSFNEISVMHDRLIAILAHRMNAPCLTRDSNIVGSRVIQTLW